MRTHPESIFVDPDDHYYGQGTFSDDELESGVEFVPAAAYLELKEKLVEAWSAGYVAGQECAKDGLPKRNPFSVVEKETD